MNYLILLMLTIIYCLIICYKIQFQSYDGVNRKERLRLLLPKGKINILIFCTALFVFAFFAVFIEYIYDNTLIDNIKFLSIIAVLCIAAYTDWNKHIITNNLIIEALILRMFIFIFELIFNVDIALTKGINEIAAAAVILILGFICSLILKGNIGMGDVKLLSVMSLFLGASGIVCTLIVSLIVAFIYCLIMLILGKKHKKDIIPFAPFLLIGTYISICLFSF